MVKTDSILSINQYKPRLHGLKIVKTTDDLVSTTSKAAATSQGEI